MDLGEVMRVLIVGFSTQNARALNVLINHHYPDCHTVIIERTFCEALTLCLPKLSPTQQTADAMIISLDGVGMMNFDARHINHLQQFIGAKPALITAKSGLDEWEWANILSQKFTLFIKPPLTKTQVLPALEQLFELIPQVSTHRHEFGYVLDDVGVDGEIIGDIVIETNVEVSEPKSTDMQQDDIDGRFEKDMAKKPFVADRSDVLHDIIRTHFKIAESALLHSMLDILLYQGALQLTMGSQTVYLDGTKNLVLVANMERLIDYCSVVSNFQAADNIVTIQPIGNKLFNQVANTKASGYRKYALNTFLWHIYSCILPANIEVDDHYLLLKIRYMPNFMNMGDVPEYVRHIVSSCVVAPRNLDELMIDVAGTQVVDKSAINRIFLLAILSGTADIDILKNSFNYHKNVVNNLTDDTKISVKANRSTKTKTTNTNVQKAKKSGFLKRFLSKLMNKS